MTIGGVAVPIESKTVQVWRLGCPVMVERLVEGQVVTEPCPWKTSWHTKPVPDLQSELLRHVQTKHKHAA